MIFEAYLINEETNEKEPAFYFYANNEKHAYTMLENEYTIMDYEAMKKHLEYKLIDDTDFQNCIIEELPKEKQEIYKKWFNNGYFDDKNTYEKFRIKYKQYEL